jgi:galactonate dehydratase
MAGGRPRILCATARLSDPPRNQRYVVRVISVETFLLPAGARGNWLILRVHAENGATGLGEASQSGDDAATIQRIERLGRCLQGRHIDNVPTLVAELRPLIDDHPGRVALSGIEQAIWDLVGQAAGMPVAALLGGPNFAEVQVYANINRETLDRSPTSFAASAARAMKAGFRAVKCNPFDGVEFPTRRDADVGEKITLGLERVMAVREAIGPELKLMVDCQSRFDGPLALRVARALQPLRLFWLEDPVRPGDLEGLRSLRKHANIPLATGETLVGAAAFWPLLREDLVDYILPDVKHCGGVREMMVIGHAALAAGVRLSAHNPSGPISTLISAHVLAANDAATWLEVATGEVPWRAVLIEPRESVTEKSTLRISGVRGLGAKLNDAVVKGSAERAKH